MLGDDLAFKRGEGVCEQRDAARSERPVQVGESVRTGGDRSPGELLVDSRPSTFTPKRRVRRMRDHVSELREGQNDTSGGSSETDASEFTISPAGSPAGAAVTNATPVANLPSASRKVRALRACTGLGPGPARPCQWSDVSSPRAARPR